MKRLTRVTVFLLGVVFLIFLVSEYYPAFYRARIIDAPGEAMLQPYAAEFAAAAGYKYLSDTGPPLPAPARHLHSGGPADQSPDGTWTLEQTEIGNSYHRIVLRSARTTRHVLTLQEPDPGSGTAHWIGWSSDSKAVFIHGAGRPAGHRPTYDLALVYLLDPDALYRMDFNSYRSTR
jgi:hypothetical protein